MFENPELLEVGYYLLKYQWRHPKSSFNRDLSPISSILEQYLSLEFSTTAW